jgi:hypothetical protein
MFLVAKILASFVPYCLITVNNLKRKIGWKTFHFENNWDNLFQYIGK